METVVMIRRPSAARFMARFTPAEWEALSTLRERYQQDHDHFNTRERARLRFIRWLRQTGRM